MIFDADVVIWALRGNEAADAMISRESLREISVVAYMELLQGARDKAEVREILGFLVRQKFRTLPLTEEIGRRAAVYMEEYSLAVALSPDDALIAATAVENHLPLCTANQRHFKAIQELEIRPFRPQRERS